ncbi:MAG: DNA polymerase III subunit alpha [Phycisphaerales bacterium]|nr:DNA polymerase III subunit alpha [Phycisphaerales bacterium]
MSMSAEKETAASAGQPSAFTHLHLHTEYSLLDGGNKITPLLERIKALGMNAVAVTDHGNLYGAIEFYSKAKDAGVKPILGIEAYVAPTDRTIKQPNGIADGGFHLVLLAENETGWHNLLKLSSDSFINGFYYKPRMDKTTLAQWADGLIAINGHLGSSIAHYLLLYIQSGNEAHYQTALEEARWHAQTFKPNERGEPRFFVELQRTNATEQERLNPLLIRLAREVGGLPLVADNDAHYLLAEDYDTHDSLCCISMGKNKTDTNRLQYSRDLYVKSPQQMSALFTDVPEAIENSARIAERCNVKLNFGANHAPLVKVVRKTAEQNIPAYPDASLKPENRGNTDWFVKFSSQYTIEPFDRSLEPELTDDEIKRQCDHALQQLCLAGWEWRYGDQPHDPRIKERLDREVRIISDKGISAYFLIVWDFVSYALRRGIPAAARGSGVGTMVGYVLGLSNACPEKYGLLFERFTDPDRSEYPDIDIDICQDGRAQVIDYVRQKYGHVAQIITFGRLKAKAAIKDVARVNGLSPSEGQRLANLVPNELFITIDGALQKEPDFKHEYDTNPVSRRVIDTARALEDHARHAGVHAAGVVIATQPLDNIVPLCKASGSDDIVTQWDGPTCEKLGLLKMDFLGLRTLSTIELCKKLIRRTLSEAAIHQATRQTDFSPSEPLSPSHRLTVSPSHPSEASGTGVPARAPSSTSGASGASGGADPLDLDRLSYTDQRVLDLFRRADTAGIFQFESGGMRKLLQEMQPDRLEDLIAANALFRPGPMDLIPDYCRRKHNKQAVPSIHPIVDRFTSETYGIMVYQEQVMQIVHALGDVPLRSAYTLIKAISKKKHSVIDAERPKFVEGAKKKGLSAHQANELFGLILKFAGYGFNKSHSTGYAIIAYHTAYLKTYFPNHYMAALLTYESGARKVDDWAPLLEDCRRVIFPDHSERHPHIGVEVRPPDINLSEADFSVVFADGGGEPHDSLHGHVRFGLGAIKGMPRAAIDAIIADRAKNGPFTSIYEFCERLNARTVGKAALESLIKCGAFDSIHGTQNRAAMTAALDDAIAAGQQAADDARTGQMNFFAALPGGSGKADAAASAPKPTRQLPSVAPWGPHLVLAYEKECLGFHVSGHPLDQHEQALRDFVSAQTTQCRNLKHDAAVILGGQLTRIRTTVVRQGKSAGEKMAMITLQDKSGSIDGVVFSSVFAKYGSQLQDGAIILLIGRLDRERSPTEPQIIVDQILQIIDAPQYLAARIELDLIESPQSDSIDSQMQKLASLLQQAAPGTSAPGTSNPGTPNAGRTAEVFLNLHTANQRITMKCNAHRIIAEPKLLQDLTQIVGRNNLRIISAGPSRTSNGNGNTNARGNGNGRRNH